MDIKSTITFKVEKDGQEFVFRMPSGVSLGLAYSAAFDVLNQILASAKEATERAKPEEPDADKKEEKTDKKA